MKTGRFIELWLLGTALLVGAPVLQTRGDHSLSLAWDPSPTLNVVGYVVHYGGASRLYTDLIDVGDATTATVRGLKEGMTYYFVVTAYDSIGLSSLPSNEVRYEVPTGGQKGPRVQLMTGAQPGVSTRLRFPASPNKVYELQTSEDLRSWTTVWYSSPVTTVRWIDFLDADATASGVRFYRLVVH